MKEPVIKKTLFVVIMAFLLSHNLLSDQGDPKWLLYQKGLKYFELKDYSRSFIYLRDAAEGRDYPEAEYLIGKIFAFEGESVLALRQFERALGMAHNAETDNFDIAVRLSMADIYNRIESHDKYEDSIKQIITGSEENRDSSYINYVNMLGERILELGLDRLLYYFRHEGDYFIEPHGRLGIHYFLHGNNRDSLVNLTAAAAITSSRMFNYLRDYDPEYEYESFPDLFSDAEMNRKLLDYMKENSFYRHLFYLSMVLEDMNLRDYSIQIINTLAESRVGNEYINMAHQIVRSRYSENEINRIKNRLRILSD